MSTKSYPTILFLSIFSQYLRVRITIIRGSKCCKHAFIVMAKGGRKNMFQCNICHCSATSYCTEVSNHFMVTIILLLASQRLLSCLHTSIECVLFFLLQSADCGLCAVRRTVVERYLTFEKQRFADFYISKGQSATVKCKMHQSIILLTQHQLFANIC